MCGVYTQQYDSKMLVKEEEMQFWFQEIDYENDDDVVAGVTIQHVAYQPFEYLDIHLDIQCPCQSDNGWM